MPTRCENLDLASRIEAKKSAWTAETLAEILEIRPKTLYKMAKTGRIPVIRIDAMIRFDPLLTAQWLRERTTGLDYLRRKAA